MEIRFRILRIYKFGHLRIYKNFRKLLLFSTTGFSKLLHVIIELGTTITTERQCLSYGRFTGSHEKAPINLSMKYLNYFLYKGALPWRRKPLSNYCIDWCKNICPWLDKCFIVSHIFRMQEAYPLQHRATNYLSTLNHQCLLLNCVGKCSSHFLLNKKHNKLFEKEKNITINLSGFTIVFLYDARQTSATILQHLWYIQ